MDVDETLHVALFLRDAARLAESARELPGTSPPPLTAVAPDCSSMVGPNRMSLLEQWDGWWRQLLERSLLHPRERAGQPRPAAPVALQPLASRLLPDARAWFYPARGVWIARERALHQVEWEAARAAAERAAREFAVSPDRVCADCQLLLVQGEWSQLAATGQVLISPALLLAPERYERVLGEAFAARLRGEDDPR
jgi:hypothetical protein